MRNWYELKSACVSHVAREIARPRVPKDAGWNVWPALTEKARPEAIERINSMTNMELLDLISEVAGSNA